MLGAYAGERVEVSVSYVTDPGSGGRGVFVDNPRLVTGGTGQEDGGFEQDLGPWTVPGPPEGSPANGADWARSGELFRTSAAVTTGDTVLLGFGLEHGDRGDGPHRADARGTAGTGPLTPGVPGPPDVTRCVPEG
ncbi:hypothetical protein [Streptomyces meridianus]|uniref:hypothetical protein n=1 Tax=Streptomyces meridianus TaxID=2938945 RepID=UPI003556FD04